MDPSVFNWLNRVGLSLELMSVLLLAPFFLRADRLHLWEQHMTGWIQGTAQSLQRLLPTLRGQSGYGKVVRRVRYFVLTAAVGIMDYFLYEAISSGDSRRISYIVGGLVGGFVLGGLREEVFERKSLPRWRRRPVSFFVDMTTGLKVIPSIVLIPGLVACLSCILLAGWYLRRRNSLLRAITAVAWAGLLAGFALQLAASF